MHRLLEGALAGAVGVTVINSATNLDMAIRGRPASSVPKDLMEEVVEDVGAPSESELSDDRADVRSNRMSGAGALMGSVTGVCGGIAYALTRDRFRSLPVPVASALLGVGVMALTDSSAAAAGVTHPRRWGPASWAADLVPHLLYGWSTAQTVRMLRAHADGE